MDDREQGGMTGATGSLTPSESEAEEEFVPAETREMSDPRAARQLTAAAQRRAEARRAEESDDPAYRMEERAIPPPGEALQPPGPTLGGDERHDPEDEHL
jgi:hypothetical protein